MKFTSVLLLLFAVSSATELNKRTPLSQDDPWGDAPVVAGPADSKPTIGVAGTNQSGLSTPQDGTVASMSGMDMGGMDMGDGGHAHAGQGSDLSPPDSNTASPQTANGRPSLKDNIRDLIHFTPAVSLAQLIELKPELSSTHKRTKLRFGPFSLRPKGTPANPMDIMPSMDMNGQAFLYTIKKGICSDCTILSARTGLELQNGTKTDLNNGIYLHHILVSDLSKAGYLPVSPCEFPRQPNAANPIPDPLERLSGLSGSGFVGSGDDRGNGYTIFTTPDAKYQSGYFVGKKDDFIMTVDIVNMTPERQSVYVVMDLEWKEGHAGSDATNMMFSVGGCRGRPIALNLTGEASTKSGEYAVLTDGDLIGARGRMHYGGERTILRLNGKEICNSVANYDGNRLTDLSACSDVVPVKKGDRLTFESVYDLSKHNLTRDDTMILKYTGGKGPYVMGMMDLTFAMKGVNQVAW